MVAQFQEHSKNHLIIYFKWVKYMVWELNLKGVENEFISILMEPLGQKLLFKGRVYLGVKMCYQTLIPLIIVAYDFIQSIIQQVLTSTNSSNICLPLSSYPLKFFIIYFPISRFNHFSQILVLDFLNRLEFKRLFLWDVLWCHCRTADHFLHLEILLLPSLILYSCFQVLWDPSAPSLCSSLAPLSLLSLKVIIHQGFILNTLHFSPYTCPFLHTF